MYLDKYDLIHLIHTARDFHFLFNLWVNIFQDYRDPWSTKATRSQFKPEALR